MNVTPPPASVLMRSVLICCPASPLAGIRCTAAAADDQAARPRGSARGDMPVPFAARLAR